MRSARSDALLVAALLVAALLVAALLVATLLWGATPLLAQGSGDYLNFETPQVKPITVARVAGHDYVLACNTPDASVEIRDTFDLRLVARVRVGQEPVSVVWNPGLSRFYTANMLGDSVSVVALEAASPTAPLRVTFERTVYVGDEPMMVAFLPDDSSLFVTHNQKSAMSWRHPLTLEPMLAGFAERILLTDAIFAPKQALKEPRAILWSGTALYALGFRGGHSFFHDADLWSFDFATLEWKTLGGLGSLKTNMAAAGNGDLWIVGGDAQNHLRGRPAVAAAKTGFVRSLVHRIERASAASARVATRDLNADSAGNPVAFARALAHPTDVALLESGGKVVKVFVAAFHSDRIGTIVPDHADPSQWTVRTIDVPRAPRSVNAVSGPRGLAIKYAIPELRGDPGDRLYALNRLDSSLAAIDPARETVLAVVPLAHDPVPRHVRDGQRFLYSAKLSGSGFVACASCHLDGRTDGLAWDLGEPPSATPSPLDPALIDGVTDDRIRGMTTFPNGKGPLVTQSLQGLVNSETVPDSQGLFTNAPYHWRGDTDFASFNAAFVQLMGAPNLSQPNEPPRGISAAEMRAFERFINTIAYPPNPEQPLARRYSGELGDPDLADGSGALKGLKLFHTERIVQSGGRPDPVLAGRSCVQCHALPEGSNNRITRLGISTPQPVETAQLRGLLQKEALVELGSTAVGTIVVNEFGTEHQGTLRSINDFNQFVFGHDFPGPHKARLDAMTQFVRELDTGVAPIVGLPVTIDRALVASGAASQVLSLFEDQARRAHAGVALQATIGGRARGFWFLPDASGGGDYEEEPGPRTLTRSAVLALVQAPGDRLVVQGTPLGSERRLAAPSGVASVRRGRAPSRITLEPLAPSDVWEPVQRLRKNWVPGPLSNPLAFAWTGVYSGTSVPVPEPAFLKTVRLLQLGLIQDGPSVGLAAQRHEAPLRLRVSGDDVRPGAELLLLSPDSPSGPPPHTSHFLTTRVRVYPTGERGKDGRQVFASAAELEPLIAYVLCLGGPHAPGVGAALRASLPEPPAKGTFDPARWNLHAVFVWNEDGTFATGGWQPLRLR